jgi:hypothetical protein
MSESFEGPLRYKVTFANGDTKKFDSPMTVVVEASGALKIQKFNETRIGTWYAPSAWTSLDIQFLKT